MSTDRSALPPADVQVRCARQWHVLHWADGTLTAVDHPDLERERALVALGGERYRCLDVLATWDAHADDLDVLALAGRGGTDEVRVTEIGGDEDEQHAHVSIHGHRAGVVYRGSYRPIGRSSFGRRPHDHEAHRARPPRVESLLTLDRTLAACLVATVIGTWAQRIDDDDARVAAARPALDAALYGRALRSVRTWLGDPSRTLELRPTAPGGRPYVAAGDAGAVLLGLGFEWLRDVWVPGLATSFGRLCLTAERTGPTSWSLLSVGPDFGEPALLRVSW